MPSDTISSAYAMYCNPNGARRLSKSFQVGKYDVMCARGKKAHESEGNRRFRALVKLHQTKYAACTCKVEKSKVVSHIVNTVRNASPNGGFVKIIDGEYWEAGDRAAKEKVGQTFRDLLHTKYSSSTKAKARARMEKKEQQQEQQQQQPLEFPQLNMNTNMQEYPVQLSSSPDSSVSVVSNDSSDSSDGQLSPTPRKSFFGETASVFQQLQTPQPIFNNIMHSLRGSIKSMEGGARRQSAVISSLRSSTRNSLLRSSIHTIDEETQLRSSIQSFGTAPESCSKRDSIVSLVPLSFLEGSVINVQGDCAPMSGIEKEFATANMELDDSLKDLQDFLGSMGVAV